MACVFCLKELNNEKKEKVPFDYEACTKCANEYYKETGDRKQGLHIEEYKIYLEGIRQELEKIYKLIKDIKGEI